MSPEATQHGFELLAVGSALLVLTSIVWHAKTVSYSYWGRVAVVGLILVLVGVVVLIFPWALAGWQRVPPAYHAPWIFEHKDLVTAIGSICFSSGCVLATAGTARRGKLQRWVLLGGALAVLFFVVGYELTPQ